MMIQIETKLAGISTFRKKAKLLSTGAWEKEAFRGVVDAGRLTKTQVQRAVHQQMATRRYTFVSSGTRGTPRQAELAYEIYGVPGGKRIEEYKGLRSARSGRLADPEAGGVSSAAWNAPRTFKRSFAAAGGFFATLPGGQKSSVAPRALWTYGAKKSQPRGEDGRFVPSGRTYGPIRRLMGPALRKEIVKDESLATFQRIAPVMLEQKVVPRIAKLMTF